MRAVVDGVTVKDKAASAVRSTVTAAGARTPPAVIGVTEAAPVAEAIVGATPAKVVATPLAMIVPDEPLDRTWIMMSKSQAAAVVEATVVMAAL